MLPPLLIAQVEEQKEEAAAPLRDGQPKESCVLRLEPRIRRLIVMVYVCISIEPIESFIDLFQIVVRRTSNMAIALCICLSYS